MSGYLDILSYQDLLDHVTDYFGADPTGEADRYARRAVEQAYREIAQGHRWSYLYQHGHLVTTPPYTTGSMNYLQSSGMYPYQVTLTGGTWPNWAGYGVITLGGITLGVSTIGIVSYEVDQRISDTVLTLRAADNPGGDITSPTNFTLYRDSYPMPIDFIAADEMVNLNFIQPLSYRHPREWLSAQRIIRGPAVPRLYSFMGDPKYQGTMCVKFYPPPDDTYQIDYVYQRRPRPMRINQYNAGTVSFSPSATTITGVGTTWNTNMVGALIRVAMDNSATPTGLMGASPALDTRVVAAVTNATTLSVDQAFSNTLSGVAYSISDPVDIEAGAMTVLMLRECERQARLVRRVKPTPDETQAYEMAQKTAWEGDSRNFGRRSAGTGTPFYRRLAWMPRGPDS